MIDALGNPQSMLVLGGTSEIALATAVALSEQRLRSLVLAGRDDEALEAAAADLRSPRLDVEVEHLDVLDTDSHEKWVADVVQRHGCFDVVLLAFGVLGDQVRAEGDSSEALRIVRTNYVGAVSLALPMARQFLACGHGVLVVLSSVAGDRARRSNFVYGSSKAGLDAFAQGLGDMLHGRASIIVVRPGFVTTRMTAGMKRAPFSTSPDVVATAIVKAIRTRKEVVYVPGPLRILFAVLRHMPRAAFRRLPI